MRWDPTADLSGTVVVVYPIPTAAGRRLTDTGFLIPPLGVMYLSAQLKRRAIPVLLVNEEVDGEALPQLLAMPDQTAPLLLGIYANHNSAERVMALLRGRRRPGASKVAVGGPSVLEPEGFLEAGADVAGLGEGDETILDLAAWAAGEKELRDIPGVAYLVDRACLHSRPRPLVENLDALPIPDWEFHPPNRVPFDNLYPPVVRPFASLITSRGCPMRCTYCSSPTIWRRKVRKRSVGSVLQELDFLVERFGVRFVDIYDDVFNLKRDWIVRFCEALVRKGTPVLWSAYFYPVGFDAELLRLAKAAGLRVFKIGVQSGSPKILENIGRRPATLEQARLYLAEATRLGLFSTVDFIVGLPGETRQTLDESSRYIATLQADSLKIGKLRLLPGSPLSAHGLRPEVEVSDAELDAAIRRMLFGYYLRPRRLLRTARWAALRGLSWARLKSLGKLTRLALTGEVFPAKASEIESALPLPAAAPRASAGGRSVPLPTRVDEPPAAGVGPEA